MIQGPDRTKGRLHDASNTDRRRSANPGSSRDGLRDDQHRPGAPGGAAPSGSAATHRGVLHDLQRIPNTVRAIAGDVTRRRIGDPPTDKLLERLAVGDYRHEIGYRSQLPDGRILQSTTIVYTDRNGHAAAALCLNADVSAWVSLRSVMDRFVLGFDGTSAHPSSLDRDRPSPDGRRGTRDSEYFPHSVEELSARLVDAAIASIGVPVIEMRKEQKIQVVAELERRGFFLVKQAAESAAAALSVTRFTIYNYLNQISGTAEETSDTAAEPA